MTARPWGPVIAFCLLAGALVNANNEEGLGRFHLGHHHSRERTHSHPEANHVQWTSVLTADQHARSLGYMVRIDAPFAAALNMTAYKSVLKHVGCMTG